MNNVNPFDRDREENPHIDLDSIDRTLERQKIEATNDATIYLKRKPVYSFFKRFFDIFLSGLAILVFSPLLLLLALLDTQCFKPSKFYQKHT